MALMGGLLAKRLFHVSMRASSLNVNELNSNRSSVQTVHKKTDKQ